MQERMFIQTICPLVHVVRTQMRERRPRYTRGNVCYFVACLVMQKICPWVLHRAPTGWQGNYLKPYIAQQMTLGHNHWYESTNSWNWLQTHGNMSFPLVCSNGSLSMSSHLSLSVKQLRHIFRLCRWWKAVIVDRSPILMMLQVLIQSRLM